MDYLVNDRELEPIRDERNPALAGFNMNDLIRDLSARLGGWSEEALNGPEGMLIRSLRELTIDKSPHLANHPVANFAQAFGKARARFQKKYGAGGFAPYVVDEAIKEAF